MINYDMLEFDEFGEVILRKEPLTTAKVEVIEKMAQKDESELTPFWKKLFEEWRQQGILN